MIRPAYHEITSLKQDYSIIPVCREIYADVVTPITLLRKIAKLSRQYYLLESIEGGEQWGRYSFLGYDPVIRVRCKNGVVTIENGEAKRIETDDPMQVLRDILKDYQTPRFDYMPPFTGGLVGYFAYEMIRYAEPVLKLQESDCDDFDLMLFDKVIAYDHLKQKIDIVVNIRTDALEENYRQALLELDRITALIEDPSALPKEKADEHPVFTCNLSKEQYCDRVDKAKEHILDGDIFQIVPSRRFETDYASSLMNAYRVLRTTNPSPYMVYLQTGDVQIAGTSPETLIKLNAGHLSTFPVAGTRPRGRTPEEDLRLEEELLNDEKELAEHNMLVDLARNDIGKISKFGSVRVEQYMKIHRYSQVMHITSVVGGTIRQEYDALDAIAAALPAGTLSGAPKIRACEIINKLEPCARGIYGGAIGYIDFSGNMDTCIAIRMAVKKNGRVYVQAGGGVVADSVPENEYMESGNKAKAIINAVCKASEVND
ncbi:anthranilate synthase component I [Candidatus Soleaferrea massiliensis]|uniref:anthranilate synthase component I n=1 Tax=Candidatus Soleaferrea massiliensis TaxID=1470354 RepID=UPI00058FA0F7|nr:anthranilate synthase component I [Candidatus Soleaferrea massiliensis]